MPPKSKSTNKVAPPKLIESTNQDSKTASGLDPEAEDRFELELCWCIQQLENGLMNSNPQEKKAINMNKCLTVLKSQNASLIKKRQVMRNTFGDYRSKMLDDEKNFKKSITSVKFMGTKKIEAKSQFLKKASNTSVNLGRSESNSTNSLLNNKSMMSKILTDNKNISESFKFNFSQPDT